MQKPPKTLADYLVVAISPILIMILVGSLAFFLIQVFYRGEMVRGIRWLMFWFVLAIVLVSRVGIEQGKGHARFYGAALAIVTWLYLAYMQTIPIFGAILLGITWWCAHQLTVDCTLINDDEDASGEGVLQGLSRLLEKSLVPPRKPPEPPPLSPLELLAAADLAKRSSQKPARSPGRSVVYFSLAALPLFGIGQLFLPADDPQARLIGFAFLALYLSAALSLLVTTSFLGLRRYLRQRFVEMPGNVTFGWIKFGVFLAGGVLLLALIFPRPGANRVWKNIARIESKQHKASEQALPFNPPGEGEGAPADRPNERGGSGADSKQGSPANGTQPARNPSTQTAPRNQPDQPEKSGGGGGGSGTEGSGGQGSQGAESGDRSPSRDNGRAPPRASVQLKDKIPSGNGDQSSDREAAGPEGTREPREGNGGRQQANSEQPSGRREAAKNSPTKEPKPGKVSESTPVEQPEQSQPESRPKGPKPPSHILENLLRALLILALVALIVWVSIRYRKVIAGMARSFFAAVREFFRKLFSFRWRRSKAAAVEEIASTAPVLEPFAAYQNPFVTGKDKVWPTERLLVYTYEAVRAWAKEQKIQLRPQQTPREFCSELIEHFPDFGAELEQFSFYYSHAAFAKRLPADFETDSIRRLWQYLGDSVAVVASN